MKILFKTPLEEINYSGMKKQTIVAMQLPMKRMLLTTSGKYYLSFPHLFFRLTARTGVNRDESYENLYIWNFNVSAGFSEQPDLVYPLPLANIHGLNNMCLGAAAGKLNEKNIEDLFKSTVGLFWNTKFQSQRTWFAAWNKTHKNREYLAWANKTKEKSKWIPPKSFFKGFGYEPYSFELWSKP